MDHLDTLLPRAANGGVFGTKMRSVINAPSPSGIAAIVDQQFAVGLEVLSYGLVPILEPEININMPDKATAEALLRDAILAKLSTLTPDQIIMLKLTLPEQANIYQPLVDHPNVMRVVALSGGYSLEEANARLAQNRGIIASFSRALSQDLSANQSDAEFNATIAAAIDAIYTASVAG